MVCEFVDFFTAKMAVFERAFRKAHMASRRFSRHARRPHVPLLTSRQIASALYRGSERARRRRLLNEEERRVNYDPLLDAPPER